MGSEKEAAPIPTAEIIIMILITVIIYRHQSMNRTGNKK